MFVVGGLALFLFYLFNPIARNEKEIGNTAEFGVVISLISGKQDEIM